jgi:hypothetical protein
VGVLDASTSRSKERYAVRPDVAALPAAGLTSEQGFDIGQPDIIGPSIGADRGRMAAMIVRAIDQETARA